MCGIFGIAVRSGAALSSTQFNRLMTELYLLSESRGKESAGLHLFLPDPGEAWTLKSPKPPSALVRSAEYKRTLQHGLDMAYHDVSDVSVRPLAAIAHSRLVTNGAAEDIRNNQPVRWGSVTMIHNGIIVNVDELWAHNTHLQRNARVDTEIMAALLSDSMSKRFDPFGATREIFRAIEGAASIAWVHDSAPLLTMATNTGDLYCCRLPDSGGVVFSSERYILEKAISSVWSMRDGEGSPFDIFHVQAGDGVYVDLTVSAPVESFSLGLEHQPSEFEVNRCPVVQQHDVDIEVSSQVMTVVPTGNEHLLRYNADALREIRRCSRCILPETFPFIEFDDQGVCNYCHGYRPKYRDVDPQLAKREFLDSVIKYRSAHGSPDVLVPFSGGRDSCYGLHLIKNEFGFEPITFTYDWGMVTDLARRNIARLCGKLGVQNILVSADIKKKRENIRKNVSTWLKKPDLGMVPLFMAGDKHFFKIVNQLKEQTGIRLDLWSANPLENTDFKAGFCNISPDFDKSRIDYLSVGRKMRLATYYFSRFLANPGYFNSSLLDTGKAFLSYYLEPRRDFYFMFHHLVWNEDVVNEVLLNNYDFEMASDSPSTWRIGDGTAPFYNYIYVTAQGFSEFDTFHSNQIREGQITRDQALQRVLEENRPRTESLRWYLDVVGLDFDDTIQRINELDRLGLHR